MDLKLSLNLDNDDFQWMPEVKTARILREVADKIAEGLVFGKIQDINGNTVGDWEFYNI